METTVNKIEQVYIYATEAHHKLGDISRYVDGKPCWDEPGLIERGEPELIEHVASITKEDSDSWIGMWVTGIGAFDVEFPKKTSRALTVEEIEELSTKRLRINSQPSYGIGNLEIETFYDLEKAKKFKESHECVSEMHGTTLMGPLKHCNEI